MFAHESASNVPGGIPSASLRDMQRSLLALSAILFLVKGQEVDNVIVLDKQR
jgi:hypothetical protein